MADQGSRKRKRGEIKEKQEIEDQAQSPCDASSPTSSDGGSPKRRKGQEGNPIKIGEKIYSCATCRNGHRVSTCRHLGRYMVPANKPGRPKKGDQKRIKCKCPSPQECTCTEVGYWLVYIPGPNEPQDAKPTPRQDQPIAGTFVSVKQAHLDAKGLPISDDEYNQRQQKLEALKKHTGCSRSRSASSTVTANASTLTSSDSSTSQPTQEPKPQGCCDHKNVVAQQSQETVQPRTHVGPQVYNKLLASLSASALFHGCNCGAACSCAFCPQHPNNNVSQNLARQHANTFINHQRFNANQNFMQTRMPAPDFSHDTPCTGGTTRQTYRRGGTLPTYEELVQEHFDDQDGNGTVMAYPMEIRPSALMPQATTQNQMVMAGPQTQNTMDMPDPNMAGSFTNPLATDDRFHVTVTGQAMITDHSMQSWSPDNLAPHPQYNHGGQYGFPATFGQPPMAASSVDQGNGYGEYYTAPTMPNHPHMAVPSAVQNGHYVGSEMFNQQQMPGPPMEQSITPIEQDFTPATSDQPYMESTLMNGNGTNFHSAAQEFGPNYSDLDGTPSIGFGTPELAELLDSWVNDPNSGFDFVVDPITGS